jgi:hypothetical protein
VLRKLVAPTLLAALLAALFAVVGPRAEAQVPELNLDVTIDPTQGPPGTVIHATVDPTQANQECITDPVSRLTQILVDLAAGDDPNFDAIDESFLTALGAALQSGAIPFDIGLLYIAVFADIITQQPVEGSEQPMWNPFQGEVDIPAPEAAPGTYAVAMICLGLNEEPDTEAMAEELEGLLDPSDPSQLETAAERLIPYLVDQEDPLGLGVALFCLDNAAETACTAPPSPGTSPSDPPALAVPGDPAFTG